MPDEPSGTDRAMELLVYGPLGLAAYLRDTAPSFLRLFVSRGRAIVDGQRRSAEGQLANARAVGEFASVQGGPQVRRVVGDALAAARARTDEALQYLGGLAASGGVPPPSPPRPGPSGVDAPTFSVAPSPPDEGVHLAIRDYDELSASQVVERLEGLPRSELDAIRAYEASHRARNTVLGKIEQLQRPVG
ncbi:MAG TPA: hypothetical protein VGU73_00555 [Acidimicrobiia bacterium]|nr:hypothetical protein [Acidimicrobiia bacterium]